MFFLCNFRFVGGNFLTPRHVGIMEYAVHEDHQIIVNRRDTIGLRLSAGISAVQSFTSSCNSRGLYLYPHFQPEDIVILQIMDCKKYSVKAVIKPIAGSKKVPKLVDHVDC